MSPEVLTVIMLLSVMVVVMTGFPLAFGLAGIALVTAYVAGLGGIPSLLYLDSWGILNNYPLLAAPLFIFMGLMLEKSGVSERLFGAMHVWLGGLSGGLAISTVFIGAILAACVGVIGASVTMLGLIALPAMLKRGYDKEIATGAVCAGGTLGILIPPSVMLVVYGPTASISVGKLFMGAVVPGFVLAGLYAAYIGVRVGRNPQLGPPAPAEERAAPIHVKLRMLVTGLLPPLFLILAVLGSIFFGIAPPTEAAAVGAFAAVLLVIANRSFNLTVLKQTAYETMRVTAFIMLIAIGAKMFTGTFMSLGGGGVIEKVVMSVPFGRWGAFAAIMLILFILGMFIDWIGIVFIMVPMVTPIGAHLGFDPLWFALMICINLQMSFMTPPFAYAIFYLKGIVKPEWGVETMHIIRGVIPFIILVIIGLVIFIVFPQLVLWLPSLMIK